MDDRMRAGRDQIPSRSAPSAPGTDASSLNGRHEPSRETGARDERSSSAKPALTDRERQERWPVG
jgi:hypothetical protein